MEMSYHCRIDRQDRVQHIINVIGLGQIVREKYTRTHGQITRQQAGRYICVTDTGITIIKSEDKTKVITMYVTTSSELVMVFGGKKNVPAYLRKKVDRNQTFYTENGKTIWK